MHKPRTHQTSAKPLPTAIITGASSGLGRALALRWAASGARVIALGRSAERLDELAHQQPGITPLRADLSDSPSLPALMHGIIAAHADVACLVNNAGIQRDLRLDSAHCSAEALGEELATNLLAPMLLTQALLPLFQRRGEGWFVNIGSVLGLCPKARAAGYSASKAGLRLFGDALRVQLRGSGIRVVEVLPPLMDTPMAAARQGHCRMAPDLAAQRLIQGLHQGREHIALGPARLAPSLHRWAPGLLARRLQTEPTEDLTR